ncbi:Clip-Associating Protein 1 [Manis pentadactyla]|nr:Clip-Associating Protein 1 [Manis pentadactyla]
MAEAAAAPGARKRRHHGPRAEPGALSRRRAHCRDPAAGDVAGAGPEQPRRPWRQRDSASWRRLAPRGNGPRAGARGQRAGAACCGAELSAPPRDAGREQGAGPAARERRRGESVPGGDAVRERRTSSIKWPRQTTGIRPRCGRRHFSSQFLTIYDEAAYESVMFSYFLTGAWKMGWKLVRKLHCVLMSDV